MGIHVADALFTRTQQRVLTLLFADPDRSFIQQELIDGTGSGSGAVQRELARLVESGLVEISIFGRKKHYRANRGAAIYDELRSIVAKTLAAPALPAPAPPPRSKWQLIFD